MPEIVYGVQVDGRTMIVFDSMVNAQGYAQQYNARHEPEDEKQEAEVRAWQVMRNAHKYRPGIVPQQDEWA